MFELPDTPRARFLAAAALVVLLRAAPASAHKIHVFAYAQGTTISGEVYFSGGSPARAATVELFDPAGKRLGQTTTNEEGHFNFRVQRRCDHRVVVDTGDGHAAEYTVAADELSKSSSAPASEPGEPAGPDSKKPAAKRPDIKELDELIEAAVARQIVPLRKQLDRYEQQTRFRDILGGIGYILGIMGLASYFLAKRKEKGERREKGKGKT